MEEQLKEGFCPFFRLETAEPLDSALDFPVHPLHKAVLPYAAVDDVAFLLLSPVPAEDLFDSRAVLPEAVGHDGLWPFRDSRSCFA